MAGEGDAGGEVEIILNKKERAAHASSSLFFIVILFRI